MPGGAFDAGAVRVKIGALFDPLGFEKYERAVAKAREQKPVETKLHANANTEGITKYERAIAHTQETSKKAEHANEGLTSSLKRVAVGAIAAGGAYLGIEKAKEAIDTTSELAKTTLILHRAFGLTADESARWAAVAKVRGVETRALNMSFTTLSRQLDAASAPGAGGAKVRKMFADLGLTTRDLHAGTKDFNGLLLNVADGFGKMEGGARRAQIAQALLGRGAVALLPAFAEGKKGLQEQLDLANKYGVTFGDKPVKSMKQLIAAQHEMEFASLGLKVTFTRTIEPVLLGMMQLFGQAVLAAEGLWTSFTHGLEPLTNLAKGAHDALGGIGADIDGLQKKGGGGLGGLFKGLGMSIDELNPRAFREIGTAATETWGQIRRFATNFAQIISDNFGAKSGTMHDLREIATFVVSVLGFAFKELSAVVKRAMPGIILAWRGIAEVIRGIVKVIAGIVTLDFGKVMDGIGMQLGGMLKLIRGLVREASAPFREAAHIAFGAISSVANAVWNGIVGATKAALDTLGGAFSTLLGLAAKAAGAASHVPGFGWLKDVAKDARDAQHAIDNWRDSMQGRDADSKSAKRAKELASELVKAKRELSNTAVVSSDYAKKAKKVADTQADLRDELKKAPSAAKTASKAIKGVGGSATQAAGEIAAAMTSIGENTNAILGGMGAPRVKYTVKGVQRQAFSGAGSGVDVGAGAFGTVFRATGGWIGRRGEAGPDDQHIDARPGDAILNRHQLPFVDHALALMGRALDPLLTRRGGAGTTPIVAARGEAHVPRESVSTIDGALRGVFGMGIDGLFSSVTRKHDAPMFASGGGVPQIGRRVIEGPGGSVQTLGQAALDKAVKAANEQIKKYAPIARMMRAMDGIDAKHFKYVYGGGHGSFNGPYDCSGLVSAILHAGGFLDAPVTTDGLKTFGEAGDGKQITIGVRGSSGRSAHTMMRIGDRFLESGSGHGAQWVGGWSGNFPIHRHPPGFARGGIITPDEYAKLPPAAKKALGWGMAFGGRIQRGVQRFAGGGNVVGRRANILHRRLGVYDARIQDATDLDTRYQQLDRAFNFTEETFQKDDGSLDTGAIRKRWLELGRLMDLREQVVHAYQAARHVVVRAIRDLREFITRVRKALGGSHGKKGAGRRKQYRDALQIAGEDLATWRDNLHTLDVNTLPDQKLDLRDLGHERASLMDLKAEVKDPADASTADASSDTSSASPADTPDVPDTSTSTEAVQTAPSAEQIAEAARQQFESFTKGRADLFASFGSNFMSSARRDATIDAAGVRFFGATDSGDTREAAAGRAVTVTNIFPTPPPDPHTWSKQQEFELNAL